MSLIRYAQQQKDAVTDMFSKNNDCLDNYFELQEKTKEYKYIEDHKHHEAHKKEHDEHVRKNLKIIVKE
jgi:hypothetical protein